jgi:hypothetical protein
MGNQEHTEGQPRRHNPEIVRNGPEDAGREHVQRDELDEDQHGAHAEHHQGDHEHDSLEPHKELHIFVNRRKFGRNDGVKERMTGGEIAALVGVPPESAVIRLDGGSDKREIGIQEVVHIKNGEHFLVTRKVVEGGYVA